MATLKILATFSGSSETSQQGLIADAAGDLFGMAGVAGTYGDGTVFEIADTGGTYASTPTTLVIFNQNNGSDPQAGLIVDAAGDLFGAASRGGTDLGGTVFEIAKSNTGYASTPTTLVAFNNLEINGSNPQSSLISDAAGDLFGTTFQGGPNNVGTVFEIAKTSGGYASTPTTLVSFNLADGSYPIAGLVADGAGDLFGTTTGGGVNGDGTLFEIAKTITGYATTPTTLINFGGIDGTGPSASLIVDPAGDLFGTTENGGANNYGTVFELDKTASGYSSGLTTLVSFNRVDGEAPEGGLIADAAGDLFGTTNVGGTIGYDVGEGTVFEVADTGGSYASTPTTLATFNYTNGANPFGTLVADSAGNLFGRTQGGPGGYNTVFELTNTGFVVNGGGSTPSGGGTTVDTVQGAGGTSLSLDFGAAALATIAAPLLAGITSGSTLFVTVAGASAMSAGQTAAVDTAAGAVTVTGNGAANETIAAGAGPFSFIAGSGSGTVVAGGGADAVSFSGGGNWMAELGGGADTVTAAAGNDTLATGNGGSLVFLGAGADSIASAGADTMIGGTGTATINASGAPLYFGGSGATFFNGLGASATLVGGGAETVDAGAANALVFAGSGALDFNAGSGASTVVGGAGGGEITGGSQGLLYFGTGPTTYTPGTAVDTVLGFTGSLTATGGAKGTLFFTGTAGNNDVSTGSGSSTIIGFGANDTLTATGPGNDVIAASGAAETVNGANSTGSNTFFAFSTNDVLIGGSGSTALESGVGNHTLVAGSGAALFEILDSGVRGVTLENFNVAQDFVQLPGYAAGAGAAALQTATISGGNEILTLPDGTNLTFVGVTNVSASSFV